MNSEPFVTLEDIIKADNQRNEELQTMFPCVQVVDKTNQSSLPSSRSDEDRPTTAKPPPTFISSELVEDYRSFLLEAEKAHKEGDVTLTTWELEFVSSCKDRRTLSSKQGNCIDKMIQKYSGCFDW